MCPLELSAVADTGNNNTDTADVSFLIDAISLYECPLKDNPEIYSPLGASVTSLTLTEISEEDVLAIFPMFTCIRHLSLKGLTLLGDTAARKYPAQLQSLSLVDCRINKDLLLSWFYASGSTLTKIEVCRSHYKLSLDHEGSLSEPQFIRLLPNVRHLKLKESGFLKFASCTSSEEFSRLELVAKKCILTGKLLFLKYLSFDVLDRVDEMLEQLDCKDTLHTLILRNCPRNIAIFNELTNLRHLRIINGVQQEVMDKLKLIPNLQTLDLDVHCTYPAAENQLLMLDDDSLIHILSYLSLDDWISVRQTDSRLDGIVRQHMFPSAQVKIDDKFLQKYPLDQRLGLYKCLGQHVRSLLLSCEDLQRVLPHFVCLRKLYMPHRQDDAEALSLIPDGLRQLDLFIHHENQSLAPLFQRLNRTLTSLEVCGPFDLADLKELHHIREIKLGGLTSSYIDLEPFLRQNEDHLERFEVKFYEPEEDDDEYYLTGAFDDTVQFSLIPLRRLRVLRLDSLSKRMTLNPRDFPRLEELRLSFENYVSHTIASPLIENVLGFSTLKTLHINGLGDYRQLYRLQNLRCLEIYEEFLPEEVVLEIFANLPMLERLGTENDTFSLHFELSMQSIMRGRSCDVTLYHCVWPATKILFGVTECTKIPIIRHSTE